MSPCGYLASMIEMKTPNGESNDAVTQDENSPPSTLPEMFNTKRSGRVANKSEASVLEHLTRGFLGTGSRTTAFRAAEYRPTLEKFSSVSFSDYVRAVLMGVPIKGIEPEKAFFPSSSDTEEDEIKSENEGPITPRLSTPASDLDPKDSTPKCTPVEILPASTPITNSDGILYTQAGQSVSSETAETKQGLPRITRMKTRLSGHINAISGVSYPLLERSKQDATRKKEEPRRMTTRSQTRPKKLNFVAVEGGGKSSSLSYQRRRRKKRRTLLPDSLKLSDGIAKICPPEGWWDKAGIGKDTSGRGKIWQAGHKLGDMTILGPIKQCASGIGGIYDFTMIELGQITVADFRQKADDYRKRQIGKEYEKDESDEAMDNLARKFWRRLGPTMEASIYGADMEGSLFNGAHACGWNVDQLESCLQLLRADAKNGEGESDLYKLPGVTNAYLYFGMWASVFAAHTEDMNLLSINYLHAGAPKYWYAISPEDSDRFESLMASHFSAASASCADFLRHKRYLLSPAILSKAGISYTTQVQRAGDIMITFPGSYHFGFNTGFNVAESTNFAVPEWVPMGDEAQVCMCHPHSVRIDMKRFKTLLDQYEFDTSYEDEAKLTYTEWAKLELKKKKGKFISCGDCSPSSDEEPTIERLKGSRTKGIIVEVLKSIPRRSNQIAVSKKKNRLLGKRKKEKEDWRLALRVKRGTFCPQTPVLCFLTCEDGEQEKCFSGIITNVVEGYARIHFAGTSKKEDIWVSTSSNKLFLDAGPESPQTKKERKTS